MCNRIEILMFVHVIIAFLFVIFGNFLSVIRLVSVSDRLGLGPVPFHFCLPALRTAIHFKGEKLLELTNQYKHFVGGDFLRRSAFQPYPTHCIWS